MIVTRGLLLALTAASMATSTPTPTPCVATGACANLRLASCENLNVKTSIKNLDLSSNVLDQLNTNCLPKSTIPLKVNLSQNNFVTLDAGTFQPQRVLVSVDFSHNFIASVSPLTFKSSNLTRLNLASNRLTSIPSLTAPSLRVFDLRNNLIVDVTNPATFASMPRLEAVYLTGNPIEAIDADVFKVIPRAGLRVCKSAATATLQGVVANLTLVECSTLATEASSHHLLFLIGITTLVSCVCALLVIAAIYLVVNMPRRRPPKALEMRALTPIVGEAFEFETPSTSREAPGRMFRPDNNGYEIPVVGSEVDRLPYAPVPPVQEAPRDADKASTSALPSSTLNHVYLKVLDDADKAPSCAAPLPATRRSLLRKMSSRELPPIPRTGDEYEPIGELSSHTANTPDTPDTPGGGRNSFSEFVVSRAASTRLTAPPVPRRPPWAIQ